MLTGLPRLSERGRAVSGEVDYRLDDDGSYVITGYDRAPTFFSFLPGLGGARGVPVWCMYLNRAQAVVSFGVADKDHAIAEYLPATAASQLVGIRGFRTFCKVDNRYYEPFGSIHLEHVPESERTLRIHADGLILTDFVPALGLEFSVEYFSPVDRPVGSLIRNLKVINHSSHPHQITLLDGLPLLLPAGLNDHGAKMLRRISEAYAHVRLVSGAVPFFATKVAAHDEAEVKRIHHGNFYAAWRLDDDVPLPVEPIIDPDLVFGSGNDHIVPRRFLDSGTLDTRQQVWENRLPCALVPLDVMLHAQDSVNLVAVTGFAPSDRMLTQFLGGFQKAADFVAARAASRQLIESITAPAFTLSSEPALDAYARQNYLDNVLRGGIPRLTPSSKGPKPHYLFARRHGDLERDYNHFELPATPLSSGPGNFRDICQNRRSDIWFYPEVSDLEIRMFAELLRPDGYNPLAVVGYRWVLRQELDVTALCPILEDGVADDLTRLLRSGFRPGELLHWLAANDVRLQDPIEFADHVLRHCDAELVADGHDGGYWIDHWTYITDLLEAFAALFPDRIVNVLAGAGDVGWFDDGAYVLPRKRKYVVRSSGLMQLNTVDNVPPNGPLPRVSLFAKLCALIAVKSVSFDYDCKGIEMEAGRPGWNDALNGLPGRFGSSTCEAAELARLAAFLEAQVPDGTAVELPEPVAAFVEQVVGDLAAQDYNWERAATLREEYRAALRQCDRPDKREVSGSTISALLTLSGRRARAAIDKAFAPHMGLYHTYYIGTPTPQQAEGATSSTGSCSFSVVDEFELSPLPLFLEGQVHALRLVDNVEHAREIHHAVQKSPLIDAELKMYKLNECLDACGPEIGRAHTFTRGWLENESVWLHMSYKYILELLKTGLYEEFFHDAATMLVPFMDPHVYGRSILENSSFLGSTVNPDKSTHGRGFVGRLTGSTAEFIHMWLLMTLGPHPFACDDGVLAFRLRPILPGAWFTRQECDISWNNRPERIPENAFACALLGSMLLVYHNGQRRDTFGPGGVSPSRYILDGSSPICAADINGSVAEKIRSRAIHRIDVWLS